MSRQHGYLLAILGLSATLTAVTARHAVEGWVGALWTLGLFVVSLHLSYLVVVCVLAAGLRQRRLPEAVLGQPPRTAILYVVRHEGDELAERMARSLAGNAAPHVDLWLLSNSDDPRARGREEAIVERLRRRFGTSVHLYRPADNPLGRKHVAIRRWSRDHPQYRYLMVCDADTTVPRGALDLLLAKAEHAANADVLVFQTHLEVHGSRTRFARFLEPGQNVVQRVLSRVNFAVFGRAPYFGHGALIRRRGFARLEVPEHVLSHDLWETAALDRAGWRVAFCEDVSTEEMLPADFPEYRARNRRWMLGTLEAWPLLFRQGLSTGTRFFLFLAAFTFLVEPVFLLWILLGLASSASPGGSLQASPAWLLAGAPVVEVEFGGLCLGTLGFIWFHRLGASRTLKEALLIAREVAVGTLVLLNSLIYDSIDLLTARWLPRTWIPMRKTSRELTLWHCLREMWLSTCSGALMLAAGLWLSPAWTLLASPIVLSFLLGGVTVYWTSKPVAGR